MKEMVLRIYEIYKPFRKAILGLFCFNMLNQAMTLVSPVLYGKIIDAIISHKTMGYVMMLAVMALVMYLVNNALWYFRDRFEIKNLDYKVTQHISNITLAKVLSFSVGQHNNEHSGVKQSIINRGEGALKRLTSSIIYQLIPMMLRVLFTMATLFYMNGILGLTVLASIILFLGITILINRRMEDNLKKEQEMGHEAGKVHNEIIRNIGTVQINAQEKKMSAELEGKLVGMGNFGFEIWSRYYFLTTLRDLIVNFTRFAVIAIGVYLVYKKAYTPGSLVIFISWTSNALGQLESFGSLYRNFITNLVAVKKYFTMMDIEPEVKVIPNPVKPKKFSGRIEFKKVSFKYPVRSYLEDDEIKSDGKNSYEAVSDLSFIIEGGQRVAFVGHSGAGKSTLVHLILRAYDPDKGQIVVDGNDLRILDLKTYREAMGVVEQGVSLFDNTLRYNITFGLNGRGALVTDEELHEIAKASCIDKFFYRLEKGFDTIIGEKGIRLSGGERQRVGIARALIKNPQILLFDEATSNLDTENEASIRESITRASEGRTTIIIAHRLSTIKDADKIFVFDKGRLVGQGKHNELIETCDEYCRLINSQVVAV